MTTNKPEVVLDEFYNAEFPRHERTSCSDEDPSNASPDGFGCKRCNAIIHMRAERLQAECEKLRERDALLVELLESCREFIDPPERNCSCHISPPCSDCVDHSFERDLLESIDAAMQGGKSWQPISKLICSPWCACQCC